jgi:hypothetical protein
MTKKQLIQFLLVFIFILFKLSVAYSQNIPSLYRKTVVFISHTDYLEKNHNIGTGFFMAVRDSVFTFFYLVTAKHVILNPSSKQPYADIKISYNLKNQTRDSLKLSLVNIDKSQNVFYHNDTSVDLAVIPLPVTILRDSSDVSFSVEVELFKSKSDFDTSYINPGTNLFYTGMFSPYIGYNKNYPITRFGKVALITDEKIQFEESEPKATLFLAETTTFGGNSGSPVFAYGSNYKINSHDSTDRINFKEQNNIPIYMAGIMKGYFQENAPIQFMNTSNMTPTYSSNIGIAAIIPSYLLYEILEGSTLRSFRKWIISRTK